MVKDAVTENVQDVPRVNLLRGRVNLISVWY